MTADLDNSNDRQSSDAACVDDDELVTAVGGSLSFNYVENKQTTVNETVKYEPIPLPYGVDPTKRFQRSNDV